MSSASPNYKYHGTMNCNLVPNSHSIYLSIVHCWRQLATCVERYVTSPSAFSSTNSYISDPRQGLLLVLQHGTLTITFLLVVSTLTALFLTGVLRTGIASSNLRWCSWGFVFGTTVVASENKWTKLSTCIDAVLSIPSCRCMSVGAGRQCPHVQTKKRTSNARILVAASRISKSSNPLGHIYTDRRV